MRTAGGRRKGVELGTTPYERICFKSKERRRMVGMERSRKRERTLAMG